MKCINCNQVALDGHKLRSPAGQVLCYDCEENCRQAIERIRVAIKEVGKPDTNWIKLKLVLMPGFTAKNTERKDLEKQILSNERTQIFNEMEPIYRLIWDYPPDWQWRRVKVMERDKYVCQQCNRKLYGSRVPAHVHHKIPKFQIEGDHDLTNLILLCEICHSKIDTPGHEKVKAGRASRLEYQKGYRRTKKHYGPSLTARSSPYW